MGAGIKTPIAARAGARRGNKLSSSAVGKRRVRASVFFCTLADHVALRRFSRGFSDPTIRPSSRPRWKTRFMLHATASCCAARGGSSPMPTSRAATCNSGRSRCPWRGWTDWPWKKIYASGDWARISWRRPSARWRKPAPWLDCCGRALPCFFRRTGWALCGGSFRGAANPHQILARLLEQGLVLRRRARIQVRPWRRWEEDAIARVYRQNLPGSFGLLERTRAYWHWLLERRAYDRFYVALDGPDLWDFKETSTRVVGYAAIRGEKIIELLTVPGRKKVLIELLARACGDAIEQDQRQIALHGPANGPALDFFHCPPDPAQFAQREQTDVCMARLLDPLGLLRKLCCLFTQRATEAGLARPVELGLLVDGRKYQIDIVGSGRATADTLGRSYLRLNVADFTRLVLGQLDLDQAVTEGRVEPSTALAHDAARVLFPRLPYWRPLLDDLLA